MGIKLLRKMGWKEGQGVGPREKRKKKKKGNVAKRKEPEAGSAYLMHVHVLFSPWQLQ
jgi:hypothetical protein